MRRLAPFAVVLVLAACSGGGSAQTGTATTGAADTSTASAVPDATAAASASPSDPAPAPASPSAASPSAASPSAPSTSASGATSPSAAASGPAAPSITLVLEPNGLGYLTGGSTIRHVPFGTTDKTVLTNLLVKGIGGAVKAQDLPECGQGPRTSLEANNFQLLLDGSTFVGWLDQGAKGRSLTTADGLGIGTTLAQLKKALPNVSASSDTLGPEFFAANGFGGALDGLKSTSRATMVYAGETCFFR